jgi:hypothetical protein
VCVCVCVFDFIDQINRAPDEELVLYLLQLIQAIKYVDGTG